MHTRMYITQNILHVYLQCELETDIIDEKKLAEICKTFSIRHWMTTSAKDNINIGNISKLLMWILNKYK